MRAVALFPFAVLLFGCGTAVVDGITVVQASYDDSRAKVLAQAETDLTCPRAQLTSKLLTVTVHADVQRIAVKGCGKDVTYTRGGDGFTIESAPPPASTP